MKTKTVLYLIVVLSLVAGLSPIPIAALLGVPAAGAQTRVPETVRGALPPVVPAVPAGPYVTAGALLYKTSLDIGDPGFSVYDPATDAWTQLTPYETGCQMAVSMSGELYAYGFDTQTIDRYDPATDTWSPVLPAPPAGGGYYCNLEVTVNGEFLYTEAQGATLWYTVGGAWNPLPLPFTTNVMGDYDPTTNQYAIGQAWTTNAHLIDLNTWAITDYYSPVGNGEWARFSVVMDNMYFFEAGGSPINYFDLGNPAAPPVDTGTVLGWYSSAAADRGSHTIYVATLGGDQLWRYDVPTSTAVPLAGGSFGSHSSLAFVGTGAPPQGPDISVSPTSLSAEQCPDTQTTQTLEICNNGTAPLEWDLSEVSVARQAALVPDGTPVHPQGASKPDALVQPFKARIDANPILLITTTDVSQSVERALNELGYAYDYFYGSPWTGIDFSPYSLVIVAMDGGLAEIADVQKLRTDVIDQGKRLIFLGGTCYQPFAQGMNDYIVGNDTNNYCWTITSPPSWTVVDPSHPLAAGLPSAYNYVDPSAGYYQIRVNDPDIQPVAVNGDGYNAFFYKGTYAEAAGGDFIWYIDSVYAGYWTDPSDYALLKQVIANSLNYNPTPPDILPWLSEAPTSGTLLPGECQDVTVTFDSTGLAPGLYAGDLLVNSNDPDTPQVDVPVSLTVVDCNAVPDISVTPTSLYSEQCPDTQTTQTLQICNNGTAPLTWSLVESPVAGRVLYVERGNRLLLTTAPADGAPKSLTEFVASGLPAPAARPEVPAVPGAVPEALTFYADRGTFDADYPGLPVEDFEEGLVDPGGVLGCPHPVDINGSAGCFDPGTILPGVAFWASQDEGGQEIALVGAALGGNASKVIVANYFADSFRVTFDPPVMAAGMDVEGFFGQDTCAVDIYGTGGLIGSTTGLCAEYGPFWGVGSDEPIVEIDIISPGGLAEGVDNVAFGEAGVPGIPWLSENPTNGTVLPGECADVTVTFDSTGLAPGLYAGDLLVNSNDPDTPQVDVPVSLTVLEPVHDADFSWDPAPPVAGEEATFTGTAQGSEPVSYFWDFGDNETATGNPASHTYAAPGDYLVTMTASNACGQKCDEVVQHTVTVVPAPPQGSLHLWKTKMTWKNVMPPYYFKIVVRGLIHDQDHARAAGVTVSGFWTYPDATQHPAMPVTDGLGRWKVPLRLHPTPCGLYQFDVTDLTGPGYMYDPGANETNPHTQILVPCK